MRVAAPAASATPATSAAPVLSKASSASMPPQVIAGAITSQAEEDDGPTTQGASGTKATPTRIVPPSEACILAALAALRAELLVGPNADIVVSKHNTAITKHPQLWVCVWFVCDTRADMFCLKPNTHRDLCCLPSITL